MNEISLKKAVSINASAKYTVVILNMIFSIVLARVLTPSDYGIYAIITIFINLFIRISDIGFGTAIIQFKELNKDEIESVFSFTFIIAVILSFLFILCGIPISFFYHNNVYRKLCVLLSIAVFFTCLNFVPNSVLLKEKRFVIVGIRTIVVNIISYGIAVICALFGGRYYALALQAISAACINFFWNNYSARLRFRKINVYVIKRIWEYSFFQYLFNWINYIETNLDQILMGWSMGSVSLAYYDRGYKLVGYPLNSISDAINPTLHPVLKDFQNDKKYLYIRYVEIQKFLSCIAVILVPLAICSGRELIILLYGEQWEMSVIPFKIICISMYPRIMMSTTGAIYCSAGNTKRLWQAGCVNAGIMAIGVVLGIAGGSINTVSFGVVCACWLNMIVTFIFLIKLVLKNSIKVFFKNFLCDILYMIIVTVCIEFLFEGFMLENVLISILFKSGLISLSYIIYMLLNGKFKMLRVLFKK